MNPNIPSLKIGYRNMNPLNPFDEFTKETEENLSQFYKLQKRLNEQQYQVDALMKVVSLSQQQQYLSEDRHKYSIESERLNSQLLDEIKQIKKQLKQIENGPNFPQTSFPLPNLPPQQYPYSNHHNQPFNSIPIPIPYPILNQNPNYQYYPLQNIPYQQPQKEERSFSKLLKDFAKKKKEEEQLNQIMLLILKNSKNDTVNEHQQKQKSRRYLKVKHKSQQDASNFNFSKSSRYEVEQQEPVKKYKNKMESIKLQEQQQGTLNQNSKVKLQPLRLKPTLERLKKLKKKLKYCVWMVIFYKNKYYQILEKKAIKRFVDEIDQYDEQFLYINTIAQFVREGQKLSLFKKSWVFTEKKDIPIRIANLIQAAELFIRQLILITLYVKFDQKHLSYIRAFIKNEGYLFPGHSAFVTQRLKLNYKRKLKFTSLDQQKMVFIEYAYIQLLLYQEMFSVNGWQELFKPFAEPLKIFVSLLQYLFIDKFKNLQIISKDMKFNIDQVPILDFTKSNVIDVKFTINNKDPKFQVTDKMPILGLYDEIVLKPVIENPGFVNLQNQFNVYVDFIYSKVAG